MFALLFPGGACRIASLATLGTVAMLACGGQAKEMSNAKSANASTQTAARRAGSDTASQPVDTGPIMDGDHSIIRSEAVGPLRVGEWRRPVMSFVYAVSARAGRDSEDIIVVRGIGKDTATLTFANDTLRKIFVTHAGPHTVSGIGVGTPLATVAGQPGASIAKRGGASVATLSSLCGVEFATDSTALSEDSGARGAKRASEIIQAISVGYCKR